MTILCTDAGVGQGLVFMWDGSGGEDRESVCMYISLNVTR